MPDEIFYPVGIITAVIVFKAHVPHPKDYETYFGFWKDDGYVKVKHLGRVDINNKWEKIKKEWIYNYKNKKEIAEQSVKKSVTPEDEWCAEAYMETDYSKIKEDDFIKEMKKYILFTNLNEK